MANCTCIKLKTLDQRLTVVQQPVLASGDVGTVHVEYELDSYWEGYTPSGTFYTGKQPENIYEQPLVGGVCVVPWEVLQEDGVLYIGLRGVDQAERVKTAAPVRYRIEKGSPCGTGTTSEPTPDVYQQILAVAGAAYDKAQSVEERADAGDFNPSATTISELVVAELANRGQLSSEFVQSTEEMKDPTKLYILPDMHIYGARKYEVQGEPLFTNLADPTDGNWAGGHQLTEEGQVVGAPGYAVANILDLNAVTHDVIRIRGLGALDGFAHTLCLGEDGATIEDAAVPAVETSTHYSYNYDADTGEVRLHVLDPLPVGGIEIYKFRTSGKLTGTAADVVITLNEPIKYAVAYEYEWYDTGYLYSGQEGPAGPAGPEGDSVTIESVTESVLPGGENVVTFSDGKTLTVKNGEQGAQGKNGNDGAGIKSIEFNEDYSLTITTEEVKNGNEVVKPSIAYTSPILKVETEDSGGVAEEDVAKFGEELATSSGWSLGEGWSGSFASGFTHASGNTDPLVFTPTIKANALYQISFKSSERMTTDNLFVQVGNSTQFNLYAEDVIKNDGIISIGVLTTDTSGLLFTPSASYTGTITDISIKEITGSYEAVKQYFDTSGAVAFEIHVTPRGLENVFIGQAAGEMNTSGCENVGVGVNVLARNTSGFWNVGIGKDCLMNNVGGSRNLAIGYNALRDNEVGQRNVSLGTFTMTRMKKGNWNIAIGSDSMNEATGGNKNVGVGFDTLTHNGGDNNIAIGASALRNNTSGTFNIGVGQGALGNNTTGISNVLIGHNAGIDNTTAVGNVGVGWAALYKNTTGTHNVSIGYGAGKTITTGKRNIIIGVEPEVDATGNYQLNIGDLLKGSINPNDRYLLLNGGLRLPNVPTSSSGNDEIYEEEWVFTLGDGSTVTKKVLMK